MRHIGSINDSSQAERFAAYLTTQGIANHVELEGDEHDGWIKDEDQLERAKNELQSFDTEPNHARYVNAVEQAEELLREKIENRKRMQKNVVNVRERWPKGVRRKAPMTITLIIISGIVALLTGFGFNLESPANKALSFVSVEGERAAEIHEDRSSDDDLRYRLASVLRGEIWRVFTPIFLHFGPVHLIFNMIMLFQLGRLLEDRYGTLFFALLVVLAAVLPNLLQGIVPQAVEGSAPFFAKTSDGQPILIGSFAGISGVVYGLFGFAWIRSTLDPNCGFQLPAFTIVLFIGWLFLGFSNLDEQWLNIAMANWGHGGGLAVGMLVAYLSMQFSSNQQFRKS